MNPVIKVLPAVLVASWAGPFVIFAVEALSPGHLPPDMPLEDRTQLATWINTLAATAFALLLMAYFFGAMTAGYVINRIAISIGYRPVLLAALLYSLPDSLI